MEFKVIIDDSLLALSIGSVKTSNSSNNLIGIVNDFEDGKWRYEKFNNFVWDNIADTALSKSEREALESKPRTILIESAKKLRLSSSVDDISKGSELAEIVLYGIMKHKFKAIPVVPKIFYKQNSQDNAKGADSVHIVIGEDGRFTLWFGEAKFYNSIEDARLQSIIESIGNSLRTDKLKKENSIITNLVDLDLFEEIDDETRTRIKDSLSNTNSIDSLKEIINIPILLLHECSLKAAASEITDAYLECVRFYHKDLAISYFQKQADALGNIFKYSSLTFHLILFPVPEKEPIIESFVTEVSNYRGKK
jgi:hypothetical protein